MINFVRHKSVMTNEVLDFLNCKSGGVFVDCTFGFGGHTNAILSASCDSVVLSIDIDSSVLKYHKDIVKVFGEDRAKFFNAKFSEIGSICNKNAKNGIDGILMDLGISSMQIDDPKRGFSFKNDGKIDMRMDESIKISAHDVINRFSESDIADIIYHYGNETRARKIAKAIINHREKKIIERTHELAYIIRGCFPPKIRHQKNSDVVTKSFMALRIYVNNELFEIENAIKQSLDVLNVNGRIAVISFHSLEDNLVKRLFKEAECMIDGKRNFKIVNKKKILPNVLEIDKNPRSRSAGLRVLERVC